MIFEVHITEPKVALDDSWKELEIILDKGANPIQPMYSKYVERDNLLQLTNELRSVKAKRVKIERYQNLPAFIEWPEYYEYHVKVHSNDIKIDVSHLGGKISRNAQKDGKFITLREGTCKFDIDCKFGILLATLREAGYTYSNVQKELVVYDSNKLLDKGW